MSDAYRDALEKAGRRYAGMCPFAMEELITFIDQFVAGCDTLPLMKLNRWLGYIQGRLIAAGVTDVETERNWTRPLFRPLDFIE